MSSELESLVLKPGEDLDGKFTIDKVLAEGGMGVIVAARHKKLGQKVAIKFLLPAALRNKEAVERFQREGRAAVQLKSEHVVRIMDVGTMAHGAPYIVMEYLVGTDLGDLLYQRGKLPIDEAIDYVLQACEAVAEAHALGIVHRDLKPANLFLTHHPDGSALIKVLDFGISKLKEEDEPDKRLTQDTSVMGSPFYMSPEQIRSAKTVDGRSDLWSLAIILYELFTSGQPFAGESVASLCAAIAADEPAPLHQLRPDIPPEVEAIVLKCLEKDPANRFQNVAELAEALAPYGTEQAQLSSDRIGKMLGHAKGSVKLLPLGPSSRRNLESASQPTMMEVGRATAPGWNTTTGTSKRSNARTFGIAAGIALIVGVGGAAAVVVVTKSKPTDPIVAAPPPPSSIAPPTTTSPVATIVTMPVGSLLPTQASTTRPISTGLKKPATAGSTTKPPPSATSKSTAGALDDRK